MAQIDSEKAQWLYVPHREEEDDEFSPLLPGASSGAGLDGKREAPDFEPPSSSGNIARWSCALLSLIAAVGILVVVLRAPHTKDTSLGAQSDTMALNVSVCNTAICQRAGSEFLANLSPNYKNIDPCTNFDAYVCDGWRDRHTLRPDQAQVGALGLMAEEGENLLRVVIEGDYPGSSAHSTFSPRNLEKRQEDVDRANFDKLKTAYNACKDEDAIKAKGLAPLKSLLTDLQGTFDGSGMWGKTFGFLNKISTNVFFYIYVDADDKEPDTQIIRTLPLSSPALPIKEQYEDANIVGNYTAALDEVLAGLNGSIKYTKDLAANIIGVETKLAKVTPSVDDLQDVTKSYNIMSVKDSAALVPELGLESVLKSLVPCNYTLTTMLTAFPDYWKSVSSIIKETPKETMEGYFEWQAISSSLDLIDDPAVEPLKRFFKSIAGQDPDAKTERYRTCIGHVDDHLGWLLSRFYIEKAFSAKSKELGNQIIADSKAYYLKRFGELDWMSDSVKELAAQKVKNIVPKVGYPDASPNITNPKDLQNYYAKVNIGSDYFNNTLAMWRFEVKKAFSALGKPTDRNVWGMTAPTVNAYYNPAINEIVFPAGIMQFPFFDGELPDVVNYAAFGAVSGHELTHAFDNNGRLYDTEGKYNSWWDDATIKEFDDRAQCIIDQYSNFTVQGTSGTLHVNGDLTQGENIADIGGLHSAFVGWQGRRGGPTDQTLPGMEEFTMEQLFYISFGNVWCTKYTPAYLERQVKTNEHSPAMWRIMGTAMYNQRGFKEAFNCPVKEPVCEIW